MLLGPPCTYLHWLLDGGTQSMPLSAAIKQRLVCSTRGGPYSMLRSAAATNFAFPPSAQRFRGSRTCPARHGARGCAEACRAIEADLGAIRPGRAAAGNGHGRLAEGERAF